MIFIASLGILVLLFFIITIVILYQKRMLEARNDLKQKEVAHRQQLLTNALEVAENERQKTAAVLHDEVGFMLHILRMKLEVMRKNKNDDITFSELIHDSNSIIDESAEIVRGIFNDALPPKVQALGFVRAVSELTTRLQSTRAINTDFKSNTEQIFLEERKFRILYRIIKEILNNTVKHACPDTIKLEIEKSDNLLKVLILHDGKAITTARLKELAAVSTGIGLKSIFVTAELIGAELDFAGDSSAGACVTIRSTINNGIDQTKENIARGN